MGYAAQILADSVSPLGYRLTTFQVTFPRIVLAEVNTHKMLSKSSASSRAIPVKDKIAQVVADPFMPEAFGKNRSGMQATEVLGDEQTQKARKIWDYLTEQAIIGAEQLAEIEVHKQLANRVLEPYSYHTAILTGTDWDNFEHLRVHPAAQGEFVTVARMMKELRAESTPQVLERGQWHLPHVPELQGEVTKRDEILAAHRDDVKFWTDWAKVSAARCGRVSFLRQDRRDFAADLARTEDFIEKGHLSPLEHTARPLELWEECAFEQWEADFWIEGHGTRTLRVSERFLRMVEAWETAMFRLVGEPRAVYYCGNLNGWTSLRKLIPGEADIFGYRQQA